MRDLSNLNFMRAFAVLLVIINHTAWELHVNTGWLGVFGVYLFFVHTSLVLMWSLERQPHVLNFYIRRAFRIYPLAMAAILIAVSFNIPLSPTPTDSFVHHHYTFKQVVYNLLLIQNLRETPTIEGVMWSLPLEVQMYILLPVLFTFAQREKRIWQLLLLWGLAVLALKPFGQGNGVVSVLPYFFPGVIAFIGYKVCPPRFPAWTFAVFLGCLLAAFMRAPGVVQGWPLILCVGLALPIFRQIQNRVVVRCSHVLAEYSYGIYLGHPFGIVLGFHVLAGHSPFIQVGAELICTACIAFAGYHLIERPMIHVGRRLAEANDRRDSAPALAA